MRKKSKKRTAKRAGRSRARRRQSGSPLKLEQLEQRILFSVDCPAVIEEIEADNRGMIVLQSSENLIERFVQDESFIVTTAGSDFLFGTNDDVTHSVDVTYDRDTRQIRILAEGIQPDERYRVEVISEDIITQGTLLELDGEFNGAGVPTGDGVEGGNLIFFTSTPAERIARFTTVLGDIDVELFGDITPETVANFLNYANTEHWDGTIFHRSVNNFVIQGGGFSSESPFDRLETNDPVVNEFERSNLRGTIAMAKLGGDPDSATDQWFFNLGDNSGNLDTQNGGFTVFGEITDDDGLAVMDAIAALNTIDAGGVQSAFTDLPVVDEDADPDNLQTNDLAVISRIATLVSVVAEPPGQLDADAFTFESNRDAFVTIFDLEGQGVDRIEDHISVRFDGNRVKSITIRDGAPTRGLGIVVADATSIGSIKDARTTNIAEIGFIAANVPINNINIRGDVEGFNLNGRVLGSMLLPDDIDGDGSVEDDTSILILDGLTKKVRIDGDVDGDIVAMGGLQKLDVRGRTTGVDVVLGESETGASAALKFAHVRNSNIESAAPISSLRAIEWRDTDSDRDVISAPSLTRLSITGERRGVGGDFGADITLTEAPESGLLLRRVAIAGDLSTSRWDIEGGIGPVTVKGDIRSWRVDGEGEFRKIRAGSVSNSEVVVTGDFGSVVVSEWFGGVIDGMKYRSVKTTGDAQRGIEGDWAADILSRAQRESSPTVRSINIKGDVLVSAWGGFGDFGNVRIQGTADDLVLAAGFELQRFSAGHVTNSEISAGQRIRNMRVASLDKSSVESVDRIERLEIVGDQRNGDAGHVTESEITANFLRRFTVRGDLRETSIELNGSFTAEEPNLTNMIVGGRMIESSIRSQGDVASIFARGMFDSGVYVGAINPLQGFPPDNEIIDTVRIGSIEIQRDAESNIAFSNSYIATGVLEAGKIGPVDPTNGNVPFGVAAESIESFTYRRNNTLIDAFDSTTDGTEMIFGDFQIRLDFEEPLES